MTAKQPLMPRTPGRGFLRSGLWFIPIMSLVGASILALVTTSIDRRVAAAGKFVDLFARNPEAIRSALSVVASSILTFTALVFSVTMLVVQQASSQLSPRVVRTFLEDRTSQATLGVFLGTFAYTLLVLRDIRSPAEGISFVPGLSVALVFVAVLASLTMFVAYLSHVTESIQVGTVADRIAESTKAAASKLLDGSVPFVESNRIHEFGGEIVEWSGDAGPVRGVDLERLGRIAVRHSVKIAVLVPVGDHIRPGQPAFRIAGGEVDGQDLEPGLRVGPRTIETDARFGLRQLVDIAERALSPGVNDPTTAVQVLDRIGDVLAVIAHQPLYGDPADVLLSGFGWEHYVSLGFEEIQSSADRTPAAAHIGRVLRELSELVPSDRRRALERMLDRTGSSSPSKRAGQNDIARAVT